jgi:hypothetical protein
MLAVHNPTVSANPKQDKSRLDNQVLKLLTRPREFVISIYSV